MLVLVHKNYYISIHTTPDTFDETLFVAKVDISSKDGESIMKIATSHAFAAEIRRASVRVPDRQELD